MTDGVTDGVTGSPVRRLAALGQSVWLDFISRPLVRFGELGRLIERFGLVGVTSNPVIFERAITQSRDYDADIRERALAGAGASEIYETLALDDIRRAAELFAEVFRSTGARDGYVCLEVSPHLANDSDGTVAEARRLWRALDRPNVMIKVPATAAGLVAIEELTAAAINVNVTLLFSPERYRQVADAYLKGLARAAAAGHSLEGIASVASFFLSRIDTMVDRLLEQIVAGGGPGAPAAQRLRGEAALACARRAYSIFHETAISQRFFSLAEKGARVQRLLWASTGAKNPDYDDTKYVEPLIAPETVSTMPLATLEAYERHGRPRRARSPPAGGDASLMRADRSNARRLPTRWVGG